MFIQEDGLLHTTCGTPNYVAPEVCIYELSLIWSDVFASPKLNRHFCTACDIGPQWERLWWFLGWSLVMWNYFVCASSWIPSIRWFKHHLAIQEGMMFRNPSNPYFGNVTSKWCLNSSSFQIGKGDFNFPTWFSEGAKSIIKKILNPQPKKVLKIPEQM